LQDVEPVDARQHEIDDQQVELARRWHFAAGPPRHRVALRAQQRDDLLPERRVVLDEQDAARALVHRAAFLRCPRMRPRYRVTRS
jgi:hypothetical protein